MDYLKKIRNFLKASLLTSTTVNLIEADRLIEKNWTRRIEGYERAKFLDNMDIEREMCRHYY